jgi:hypothetical protein
MDGICTFAACAYWALVLGLAQVCMLWVLVWATVFRWALAS